MILHPTSDELHLYHERQMPRAERITVAEHLSECAACNRRYVRAYGDPKRALEIVLEEPEEPVDIHLNFYSEIVPFVGGELRRLDRLEVEMHIDWCAPCAQRIADFRARRAASEEHSSMTMPGIPAFVTESREQQSMRSTQASWLPTLASHRPAQATGLTVAVALIVLTSMIVWWRAGRVESLPEQAQMETIRPTQNSGNSLIVSNPSDGRREPETPSSEAQLSPVRTETSTATSAPPRETARRTITAGSVTRERSGTARRLNVGQTMSNDGSNYVLANSLGVEERRAINSALTSGEIERPAVLAGIITGEMTTLKGPAEDIEFRVLAPVGTVVASDRPQFLWETVEGAASYRVVIGDQDFNPVAESGQLTTNQWTPAERLPRGVVLTWQVIALVDGEEVRAPRPPAGAARFKVLERERVAALERALSASNGSPLVRGVLYARAGLVDDARREFQRLVEADPRSAVAQRLLRSVESWRAVAAVTAP